MPLERSPLVSVLRDVHAAVAPDAGGTVADYIPELGFADPEWFGVTVATVDGEVFEIGDSRIPFTIQSISKPLVFGLALDAHGPEGVLDHVGVEPSGNAFNSVAIDTTSNRPYNAMVNAGAIVTTSMLVGTDPDDDLDRIRTAISRFAGRGLDIDHAVFESERATGDRNRALAWLMRSLGHIEPDVQRAVDLYFAQCSVRIDCRDLALIGATLANDGLHPITGERALAARHATSVLSVMTTCGMYDNSGEWVYSVGLPAKSGVAGGVLAVLPGQFGVAAFSPRLDARGNSVRGVRACTELSQRLRLHVLNPSTGVQSVVRRVLRGKEVGSRRLRSEADQVALDRRRDAVVVVELQGELGFAGAERTHRTVEEHLAGAEIVVLDLTRVVTADRPARDVLDALIAQLAADGVAVATIDADRLELGHADATADFHDRETALEWSEDRLLEPDAHVHETEVPPVLADFDLLAGVAADDLAAIEAALAVREYDAGKTIFHQGDVADSIHLLLAGQVRVLLPANGDPGLRDRTVAVFGPGVAFGELALLGDANRTADVVCERASTVGVLALADLDRIGVERPMLRPTLLVNLGRLLARRLQGANAQLRALAP